MVTQIFTQWTGYVQQMLEGRLRRLLVQPGIAARIPQKLAVQKRYRVNIGHPFRVAVLLVGCGGTGSVRRGAA